MHVYASLSISAFPRSWFKSLDWKKICLLERTPLHLVRHYMATNTNQHSWDSINTSLTTKESSFNVGCEDRRTASIWVLLRLQNPQHNALQGRRDEKSLADVTFTGRKWQIQKEIWRRELWKMLTTLRKSLNECSQECIFLLI